MAAGGALCRYSPGESSQESGDGGAAGALHERLVAYVQSLEHGYRSGVWGEHSYARARGVLAGRAGGAGAGRARALLAPRPLSPAPADHEELDVDGPVPEPPRPPRLALEPERVSHEDDPADAEDWETRLAAGAPSAAHARLAVAVADTLRRMRLERLAGARGAARAAARRLRRALAPHWLPGGARSPPAWLQASLLVCLPRGARRLYEEALGELRRSVPRLAERLTGAWSPPPAESAEARVLGAPVSGRAEPWLVWVSSGCAALDARWERRLAALMHTRVLRVGRGPRAAAPDAWCAAAAGAVRDQLTDALAEAGDRGVILGGVGAGAALCVLVARGAGGAERAAGGVKGAVLVAPALREAAGARQARDDALRAVRLPLLMVVGTRAPDAPRHLAHIVAEAGGCEGRGVRRVLEVWGADEGLRLPRRLRIKHNLPQHALDAALVEECVRWAVETAEGGGEESSPPPLVPAPAPAPAPAPRRHPLPSIVHQIDMSVSPPLDEYAHLPPASTPSSATTSTRPIEILDTVSVSVTPSSHDIMQMPIVFADDTASPPAPSLPTTAPLTAPSAGPGTSTDTSSTGMGMGTGTGTGSPVTVTSGKARGHGQGNAASPVKMTRVILAKRGGRAPPPSVGHPGPLVGVRGGPRRLLVRRGGGMRLLSRHDKL